MIHFILHYARDVSDTPFAKELTAAGVPHRLLSKRLVMRYRHRLWLAVIGWPRLAINGILFAIDSLVHSKPYPDVVVMASHIEAWAFGALRLLRRRRMPSLVLLGFIFTQRRSSLTNLLRRLYFRLVFSFIDQAICHSPLEVERYTDLFRGCRARFVFIPYGLHIVGREIPTRSAATRTLQPYVFSAGRSGRDYPTLFAAFRSLSYHLHVACDSEAALGTDPPPSNATVLRNCYDDSYVNELRNASVVVIPLSVTDVSAGQMVLIEAMAYAKPVVITRTPTVSAYATDEIDALLVDRGDTSGLRQAITRIMSDPGLASQLSRNALEAYEAKYCMKAYVRNLLKAVAQ
jgi:glycosyltransferase involved in cell wall biosynthesis